MIGDKFEEIDQLRAEVARLRTSLDLRDEALRMKFEQIDQLRAVLTRARGFIKNGIALGYIRMPDPDTPDTAHEMLPLIEAALEGRRACC